MRTVIAAAIALLAGLFLGGLPARRELAEMRAELARAEKNARNGTSLLPLALGMEGLAAARSEANRREPVAPDESEERPKEPLPHFVTMGAPPSGGKFTLDDAGAPPVETFATARTAMEFRAALTKASFVDKAHLAPDAAAHLDATITKMNQELAEVVTRAAGTLQTQGEKLRPRKMVDLGVDMLEVYRRADDALHAGFDPATNTIADDTGFDLISQIDLGSFERLRDVMRDRKTGKPTQ